MIVLLLLVFALCVITYITTRLYDRAHPRKNVVQVVPEAPTDAPKTPDSIVSNLIDSAALEESTAEDSAPVDTDTSAQKQGDDVVHTADHAVDNNGGDDDKGPQIMPLYIRIQHVLLSAMVATLTVCSAKATSEMMVQSINGENQFSGWGFLIVAVFIISLPTQLHFINVSLMVNDALFHVSATCVCTHIHTCTHACTDTRFVWGYTR